MNKISLVTKAKNIDKGERKRKKEKKKKSPSPPTPPSPLDTPRDQVNRLTAGRVGVGCQSPLYTSPEQVGSPRKRWGKSAVWGPIHGTGLKETDGLKASFRGASIANDLVIARTLLSVLWPAKEGKLGLFGTRFFQGREGRGYCMLQSGCFGRIRT